MEAARGLMLQLVEDLYVYNALRTHACIYDAHMHVFMMHYEHMHVFMMHTCMCL